MTTPPVPASPITTPAAAAGVERVLADLWHGRAGPSEDDGPGDPQRVRLLSQRLGEQAMGCVSGSMRADRVALVQGSADLFATLFAIWSERGLDPREVWIELHKREQLGTLLMQLNQAQNQLPRRVLKPWRVDSTKLP